MNCTRGCRQTTDPPAVEVRVAWNQMFEELAQMAANGGPCAAHPIHKPYGLTTEQTSYLLLSRRSLQRSLQKERKQRTHESSIMDKRSLEFNRAIAEAEERAAEAKEEARVAMKKVKSLTKKLAAQKDDAKHQKARRKLKDIIRQLHPDKCKSSSCSPTEVTQFLNELLHSM